MLNKLKKSFSYKTLQVIVLFLYSLFLIPILLQNWDLEVYGSWIAIYAFFNLIRVIEQGHGKYIGNLFNHEVHEHKEDARFAIGSALRINLLIGIIQLSTIYLLYVFGVFNLFFTESINEKEVATVLGILFLYRMFFGSFRGILVKMLNPFGMIYISFQFAVIEKILEFIILVVAAVAGISLIELSVFWAIVMSIYSVIIVLKLKSILPEYYPFWKYGSIAMGLHNFKKSLLFAFSNFLTRLWNDGVVLVIAAIVGTTFLPLFSATRTLVNYGHKISDLFLSPIVPEMINQYSKNKKDNILDIFKSYWFITSIILICSYAVSLIFIEDFFTIWTKGKLNFDLLLFSALVIVVLIQNYGKVLLLFFTGINKTRIVLYSSLLQVIIFFVVFFSFKELEITAVLLGLLLSSVIVDAIWLPFNAFKVFKLSIRKKLDFYINLIAICCLGVLFYSNYIGLPIWVLCILFIPVLYLIYYQYFLISEKTRKIIYQSFMKLATFTLNKSK